MQKKALIGIIAGVVAVVVLVPVVYGIMQRYAVTNLKLDYDRTELTDIDFSQTKTISAAKRMIDQAENPSMAVLEDYNTLQAGIASPELVALDMVANTNLQFTVFINAHNPSAIDAVLDRADVIVSVNDRELSKKVTVSKQVVIPAGGDAVIPIERITLNGKDVASVLTNFVSNDFVLETNFAIMNYYPTIFGEVSLPANINLKMHTIPEKPRFESLEKPESAYTKQVAYDDRDETYRLKFTNNNDVPVSGKLQVGLLKGNALCNPACIAPIDNGIATFIRIEGHRLFDIEVTDFDSISMKPNDQYTASIHNPELRDNAKSAFVARWLPDMNKMPYVVTSEIAGISHTHTGEFNTSTLSSVRYIAYLLTNDFGYVGSEQFVSPNYKQDIIRTLETGISGTVSTIFSSESNQQTSLSLWVYSSQQDEWVSSISAHNEQEITFGGYLVDSAGRGISNQLVLLRESDFLGTTSDGLGYGYTDEKGWFTIQWSVDVGQIDWDGDAEIFARFDGTTAYSSSESSWVRVRS